MTIAVNSIDVPAKFVRLAREWYDGQYSLLYAISSTGNLTTGSDRPLNDDSGEPMTDDEWYHSLYSELDCELASLVRRIEKNNPPKGHVPGTLAKPKTDLRRLQRFQQWAETTAATLATAFGIR